MEKAESRLFTKKIGMHLLLAKSWDEQMVYAVVTLTKSGNGSCRLFHPERIILDYSRYEHDTMRGYEKENAKFLPLAIRCAGILQYLTTKLRVLVTGRVPRTEL